MTGNVDYRWQRLYNILRLGLNDDRFCRRQAARLVRTKLHIDKDDKNGSPRVVTNSDRHRGAVVELVRVDD